LAWILALFGPGHACKGSRSELLQQKRARAIAWLSRYGAALINVLIWLSGLTQA
jgi:hypothetical protein